MNLVATVYLLPFTDQITKEQMKELSTNPVLSLLLIVSFGYLAGIVLRLCRTEVTDRMSARVLRLYDTNARGGESPRNRYAYERFPYNKWLATLTERLPPQARDFYRSVWAGRSTRTFLNYCKVIVSAADAAAATEIYAAEALCRYISGMFYALATALCLLAALVVFRVLTGTPVGVGLIIMLVVYVIGLAAILTNFRFIRLKEVETIFAATFKNRRLFELQPSQLETGQMSHEIRRDREAINTYNALERDAAKSGPSQLHPLCGLDQGRHE